MNKRVLNYLYIIALVFLFSTPVVFAEITTHKSINIINNNENIEDGEYNSINGDENALIVSNSNVTLTNPKVDKTGDGSLDNGVNASVFVFDNGTLNIDRGSINTNGLKASGIYSYGTGKVNINNTYVKTLGSNSSGLVVEDGGSIVSRDTNVKTSGKSSPAIYLLNTGNISIIKGDYETSGENSPVLSTKNDIKITDTVFNSKKSNSITIDGSNNVELISSTLYSNDSSDNPNNILIYQSGNKDINKTINFISSYNNIQTDSGYTFYVTNTNSAISLTNNIINSKDNKLMKIEGSKWGTSNSNGGTVNFTIFNQELNGDIELDKLSSLSFNITGDSSFKGTINSDDSALNVSLKLNAVSTFTLTDDCYITTLENADKSNNNIILNNHKLYVNGEEVSANNKVVDKKETKEIKKNNSNIFSNYLLLIEIVLGVALVIGLVSLIVFILNKKNNRI